MSEKIRKEKETSTSSVVSKILDSTARTIGSVDTTISGTTAEDSDSYRNHLRMSEAQLDFLLQKVSPLIQRLTPS
jgi:glycerol-3-phosphate dehydrogenase